MIIGQIRDGIVLDHITAGKGMDIYNILGLGKLDCTVAMIKNADSPKMGKKDIIKISTMLDLITQSQIWNFLLEEAKRRNLGMVVVSHSDALLERVCTRIVDVK